MKHYRNPFAYQGILGPSQNPRENTASGLKLALVYKQISQVGLPYHPGQLYQLY